MKTKDLKKSDFPGMPEYEWQRLVAVTEASKRQEITSQAIEKARSELAKVKAQKLAFIEKQGLLEGDLEDLYTALGVASAKGETTGKIHTQIVKKTKRLAEIQAALPQFDYQIAGIEKAIQDMAVAEARKRLEALAKEAEELTADMLDTLEVLKAQTEQAKVIKADAGHYRRVYGLEAEVGFGWFNFSYAMFQAYELGQLKSALEQSR